MIKKFLLSATVIGIFVIYIIHNRISGDEGTSVITANPTSSPNGVASDNASNSPVPTATTLSLGKYKNGTYTGSVADAFYGNIQVQVTISGGKISNVSFLQYPNDRSTSRMINSQAMPILSQEAIQAQSAQVSGVSGASATSAAFIQSLGSALSQAS